LGSGDPAGLCPKCLIQGAFDTSLGAEESGTQTIDTATAAAGDDDFGRYRILRPLGEGGMGSVYLAEQLEPIRRRVALKVVKLGMDTAQVLARFNNERQALAMMDHPNIAQIFDAGATAKGRPYFVMEYIEGSPITEYCDGKRMTTKERLGLFLGICRAVQHAHQKGVIHRDLKPSNVLVTEQDGAPVPKVIDFGIAKATDKWAVVNSLLTQFGQIVGTPEYASPEQADTMTGDVDETSDVYSLGVLLYELLIGAVPFDTATLRNAGLAEMLRIIREDEAPSLPRKLTSMGAAASDIAARRQTDPASLRRLVDGDLNSITMKALEKARERRYASVSDLAADIQRHIEHRPVLASSPGRLYRARKFLLRKRRGVLASAVVVLAAGLGGWSFYRQSRIRWATNDGLPEIARLLAKDEGLAAFDLAQEVKRLIPNDLRLQQLWPEVTHTPLIETDPPGAEVYLSEMGVEQKPWRHVGTAPLKDVALPHGYFRWKAVKPGFAEATGAACTWWDRILFLLPPQGEVPAGMVLVPGAESLHATIVGIAPVDAPREAFFIDRFEVTNRQYKDFVDQGGYEKRGYWKVPFSKNGRSLSWEEAVGEFRDATGRPGPATWESGTFPAGKDDFPVSGVSWYEAAAYAEFAGKSLPTISHWFLAADIRTTQFVVPASNFGGQGPAKVGAYKGIGPFGTFDMAGNVLEWTWNETDNGFRFILGGAWSSPTYLFNRPDAKPPFDRSPQNGFRCARYTKRPPDPMLAPNPRRFRDYSREKPVGDEAFRVIRGSYYYEPKDLKAAVEEVDDSSPYWRKEKVSFAAGDGAERVLAFLFLPKNAKSPYQALVFHPGAGARTGTLASLDSFLRVEFIIRSGRAVIYPIYTSTYYRGLPAPRTPLEDKYQITKRYQELKRSVEYLLSRGDIDPAKLGYVGVSWGAAWAPVMLSLEDRFQTAVLFEGGLYLRAFPLPETDVFNFLPRCRVPVLMLNGRYDYTFPLATSQEPFFHWLGTPEKQKRHIVYNSSHDVMVYRTQVVGEVLSWLDRYLGPVAR